ncbi:hypothetical protein BSKO_04181 [Bryopsis sp. KO-2023]|nr:hypothetical protein BSKO_04181 [Bryopsis sp. KO-2023]
MAEKGKPKCGLFRNGTFVEEAELSPQKFLLDFPKGAYTTLLSRDGKVVDWELHLQRLNRSVALLAQETPQAYEHCLQWAQNKDAALEVLVNSKISSHAEKSLEACNNFLEKCSVRMIVILVVDGADANLDAAKGPPLDVLVYAKNFEEFPKPPCDVYVLGGPRSIHEAKHSQWVLDRRPLESLKPEGFHEVILSTDNGGLLEGLVTNFFVVAGTGKEAKLITASISDGVLGGTMRKRVIQGAISLGVPVVETPPRSDEIDTWSEAFLTNSVIGIRSVRRIVCPKDKTSMTDWERILPSPEGPVAAALADEVLSHQTMAFMDDMSS